MFKNFLCNILLVLSSTQAFSSEPFTPTEPSMLEEKASSPMLLLQAVSPDGREITFLPSQHNIPLKEISSEAERHYLHGHHCLVRESITYTEVLSDGENLIKAQVDLVTDETVHNNEGIIVKKVRSIPYKLEYFLDESILKIHQAFREEKDEP